MASITDKDREAIDTLREIVKDHITPYYDTDFNLLRWLKGHDYNIDVIKPKLTNHLLFRKSDWNLDHLADGPRNQTLHKHWKSGLTGESGVVPNTIVNIEQTGSNDYWGMLNTYSTSDILKARVYDLESMLRAIMELEKKTGQQCSIMYIMDLTGLKMDRKLTTLVSGGLAAISAFMAEHYVEMVHSFVLVNVPTFIHTIWTLARPLLPEKTRNKVNILGANWKEEVLKLANSEVLPSYWNAEDEDKFKAPIEKCVPFPESGYYKDNISREAKHLAVNAGKTGHVDVSVDEGKTLEFEVHTDGHFSFTVTLVDAENDVKDMDTETRVYPLFSKIPGPTIVPCKDVVAAKQKGTYRFWFGNKHAWFHQLKVSYVIRVV